MGGEARTPLHEVHRALSAGEGLVLTGSGWRRPGECLIGNPIFGTFRAFAPAFPDSEAFWARLGARRPAVDDAVEVIKELAQQDRKERRDVPEGTSQSIVLETLKMLRDPVAVRPDELTAGRLGRLSLVTSKGWLSKRPVYAVEDPMVAEALGREYPVWRPGAELEQFWPLAGALRLTWIGAEHLTVPSAVVASRDPEATALVREAVSHLREDLQRNAPEVARSLDRPWDELAALAVSVAPDLVCRVELPTAVAEVCVDATVDWNSRTLYVCDPSVVDRPSAGGAAIAGCFPGIAGRQLSPGPLRATGRRRAVLPWALSLRRTGCAATWKLLKPNAVAGSGGGGRGGPAQWRERRWKAPGSGTRTGHSQPETRTSRDRARPTSLPPGCTVEGHVPPLGGPQQVPSRRGPGKPHACSVRVHQRPFEERHLWPSAAPVRLSHPPAAHLCASLHDRGAGESGAGPRALGTGVGRDRTA